MVDPVIVIAYDPSWPAEFARLARRIRQGIAGIPVELEHVGSTAVPGLAAKPVIDIDIVIPHANLRDQVIARMADMGYAHEGDLGVVGRDAFEWPRGEARHHVYLVVAGNSEHQRHLYLRGYLRGDARAASEYGELKQRLADQHGDDRDAYTAAKSVFVEAILASPPISN